MSASMPYIGAKIAVYASGATSTCPSGRGILMPLGRPVVPDE